MIDGKVVVHLRAPVLSLTGYGVHSRQIIDYLLSDDRFVVSAESINWGNCPFIHNDERIEKYYECIARWQHFQKQNVPIDVSVQVTIPNEFKRVGQVNIGVTAGIEVNQCTAVWLQQCNLMDMIVVPSEFSKNVLLSTSAHWKNNQTGETGELKIEKPIVVIPEWYEIPELPIGNSLVNNLQFSTKVNLLHVGQWGNKGGFGEDRKNIADLVRYFYTIFKDDAQAGLVLKTNIIGNTEEDLNETKRRLTEIKENFKNAKCKLYLIHDTLSQEQMWELYMHPQINGFITITHGEGYGLPILEAAAAGLPVLAPNWSGHVDFLREKHGFIPLKYELVQIPECQIWEGVIDKEAKWAKVDEADLKKRWKKFVNSPKFIQDKAKKNTLWLKENFHKDAVMQIWKDFYDKFIFGKKETVSQETVKTPQFDPKKAALDKVKRGVVESDKNKVLFIMPRSTGDVLMSTAIVDALMKRHEDCDFYFATSPQYKELLEGFENLTVVEYCEEMMDNDLTSEAFEYVYNPGVNVQYRFSNWRLGNGEFAVKILGEFAKNCNLHPSEVRNYRVNLKECTLPEEQYITFTPAGSKEAKNYLYWNDVLINLKDMLPGIKIVQTGLSSEKLYEGCIDYRGKSLRETLFLIKNAQFHLGVDTFTAHGAAAVETPYVILYGSTDETVSPTVLGKRTLGLLVETTDRNGCKNPCFKDSCFNKRDGKNCISNITAQGICLAVKQLVESLNKQEEMENDKN